MTVLNKNEQDVLLGCARSAISNRLTPSASEDSPADSFPSSLDEPRGCFVTLTKRGRLRGCIGNIEPVLPLSDAVQRNALNAAFHDPRFSPVTEDEMRQVEIEISILTVPERLEFSDSEDLKHKLVPGKHGVIIHRDGRSAVFLPQVWKQLPDTEKFLNNLCLKAGLPQKSWEAPGMDVNIFEVDHFSETGRG
jgi:AmmeMemoRadiSam system protein A